VYLCTEGTFLIRWDNRSEKLSKGETALLPATIRNVILVPDAESTVLEIYINNKVII
jgi:mannose-6-phosphate isomerase class I